MFAGAMKRRSSTACFVCGCPRRRLGGWCPVGGFTAAAATSPTNSQRLNNLVKRVKRPAFGFTNFANYRIRALLYAGKPSWTLLDTLTPP